MKIPKDWLKLVLAVVGCELVGILSTPFTIAAIPTWYATLNKPAFSPPNWLFGPAWTTLYALMGVAAYLARKDKVGMRLFKWQLGLNFTWSLVFFGLHSPILGLINIAVLVWLIWKTTRRFYKVSKPAAYLMLPYLAWVSFATVLNLAIVFLN